MLNIRLYYKNKKLLTNLSTRTTSSRKRGQRSLGQNIRTSELSPNFSEFKACASCETDWNNTQKKKYYTLVVL